MSKCHNLQNISNCNKMFINYINMFLLFCDFLADCNTSTVVEDKQQSQLQTVANSQNGCGTSLPIKTISYGKSYNFDYGANPMHITCLYWSGDCLIHSGGIRTHKVSVASLSEDADCQINIYVQNLPEYFKEKITTTTWDLKNSCGVKTGPSTIVRALGPMLSKAKRPFEINCLRCSGQCLVRQGKIPARKFLTECLSYVACNATVYATQSEASSWDTSYAALVCSVFCVVYWFNLSTHQRLN